MGVSTDALLIYGIDLGEDIWASMPKDLPKVLNYDEEETKGYVLQDLGDDAVEALEEYLKAKGVTDVEIHIHCSCDYNMFILGLSRHHRASRGYPEELNNFSLDVSEGEKQNLKKAAELLGVTAEPFWLLCSMWC